MAKVRLTDTFTADLAAATTASAPTAPADSMGDDLARRLAEAAGGKRETTGRLMVYMPPTLYAEYRQWCAHRGLSMNRATLVAIQTMMEHS